MSAGRMKPSGIVEALKRLKVPHEVIAAAIDRERSVATKMMNGGRKVQPKEIAPLLALVEEWTAQEDAAWAAAARRVAIPNAMPMRDYVAVETLPAFEGAPSGAALAPKRLLLELAAKPEHLRHLTMRGDAMAPMFLHGDELFVDTRDQATGQAGPFAIWAHGDYTVRLVQRLSEPGRLRLAAANPAYPAEEVDAASVPIIGRPVSLTRRLR